MPALIECEHTEVAAERLVGGEEVDVCRCGPTVDEDDRRGLRWSGKFSNFNLAETGEFNQRGRRQRRGLDNIAVRRREGGEVNGAQGGTPIRSPR